MNISSKTLKILMWVVLSIAFIAIGFRIYDKYILNSPSPSSFGHDYGIALVLLALALNRWAKSKEAKEQEQAKTD